MSKSILFILRSSPYSGASAQEGLDSVLAASVFNQKISVLFMDEGIWQLHNHQQSLGIKKVAATNSERKNIAAQIESFPLYDIDQLYVDEKSLRKLSISTDDLILEPTELTDAGVRSLLAEHDCVLSY